MLPFATIHALNETEPMPFLFESRLVPLAKAGG